MSSLGENTKNTSLRKGYAYALLCALFSAVMIVLIKKAQEGLSALSVLFLMQAAAGMILTAVLGTGRARRAVRRTPPAGWAWIGVLCVLTFFGYWTFFAALRVLDPTVASFLGRAETLVTILFGVVFLSERFFRGELAGAVLVMAGAVVIRASGGVEVSQGFFLCMVSAAIWGVAEGLAKIAVRVVEPFVLTWGRSVVLVPVFFAAASISPEGVQIPSALDQWGEVLALALTGPVMARLLYLKSLALLPVSRVALVNQLQPVAVAAAAAAFLGVWPMLREWIGGSLIVLGCLLLVLLHARAQRNALRVGAASAGDHDCSKSSSSSFGESGRG